MGAANRSLNTSINNNIQSRRLAEGPLSLIQESTIESSPFTAQASDPFLSEQSKQPDQFQQSVAPTQSTEPKEQELAAGLVSGGTLGQETSLYIQGTGERSNERYFSSTVKEQDYGEAAQWENPDLAFTNYLDTFNQTQAQREQTDSVYNYNNYDPGDFARMGFAGPTDVGDKAQGTKLAEYVINNEIPLTQERDGVVYYFTPGNMNANNQIHGNAGQGEEWVVLGQPGTYSTIKQPRESAFNNPLVNILSAFVPAVGLVNTAMRAATGETLHAADYASAITSGLQISGNLAAPVDAAEAANTAAQATQNALASGLSETAAAAAGQAAEAAALAGRGLGSLSYAQSVGLLNAAGTKDLASAATALFGQDILNAGLATIGTSTEAIASQLNINANDVQSGLIKSIEVAASGGDIEDALRDGFVEYIKEGGSLNVLEPLRDFVEEHAGSLLNVVRTIGSSLDDNILQPVKELIPEEVQELGSATEDVIREVGSTIDDEVLQPINDVASAIDEAVREALPDIDGPDLGGVEDVIREVGSATEDVIRETGSTVDDEVLQPIKEVAEAIDEAVREVLPDIGDPDLSGLEDLIKSNVLGEQGGMLASAGSMLLSRPSPTRTTDSLFDTSPFKFKTAITPYEELDLFERTTNDFTLPPSTIG